MNYVLCGLIDFGKKCNEGSSCTHWFSYPTKRFDKNNRSFNQVIFQTVPWFKNCKRIPLHQNKIIILIKALIARVKIHFNDFMNIFIYSLVNDCFYNNGVKKWTQHVLKFLMSFILKPFNSRFFDMCPTTDEHHSASQNLFYTLIQDLKNIRLQGKIS